MAIPLIGPRWRQKPWIEHVDDTVHRVTREGIYRASDGEDYHVPVGFETDGGSVPRALWWWMPPFGDDAECAYCLHDYVYREAEMLPGMTRAKADELLREASVAAGQPKARARAAWIGVRAFGWIPWNRYRREIYDWPEGA